VASNSAAIVPTARGIRDGADDINPMVGEVGSVQTAAAPAKAAAIGRRIGYGRSLAIIAGFDEP
jgi:hypothetical protein